jgi:hypothetical protein
MLNSCVSTNTPLEALSNRELLVIPALTLFAFVINNLKINVFAFLQHVPSIERLEQSFSYSGGFFSLQGFIVVEKM